MKDIKFSFRIYNPFEKKMIHSGRTPMMLSSFFEDTATLNTMYNFEYMQYTGLKMGDVDIYEGDIINWIDIASLITLENKYAFRFKFWHDDLARFHIAEGKLLGNIYENPELLNRGE